MSSFHDPLPNGQDPDADGGPAPTRTGSLRRWRWGWRWFAGVVLLGPLVLIWFVLATEPGNRVLWKMVSSRIESASGWLVTADWVRIRLGVVVTGEGLEVVAPSGKTVAKVDRFSALAPLSMLRGAPESMRLTSARVEGLWLDLAALPQDQTLSDSDSAPAAWRLDVDELVLIDAAVAMQPLDEAVVLPIGVEPIEISRWGAEALNWRGRVQVGSEIELAGLIDGRVRWVASGLVPETASVVTRLVIDGTHKLRLEDLVVEAEGLHLAGEFDCRSMVVGPCALTGSAELDGTQLFVGGQELARSTARADGTLDVLSWLGAVDVEVRQLPMSVVMGAAPEPTAPQQPEQQSEVWFRQLSLDGTVTYSAQMSEQRAVVVGDIDLVATAPDGAVVLDLKAGMSPGSRLSSNGLDRNGRVDPWQVALEGSLRSRAATLDAVLPLVPRGVRDVVVESGFADLPFALETALHYEPRSGAQGSLNATVGTDCGTEAKNECRARVEARNVRVAATEGVLDWTTLAATAETVVRGINADALVGLLRDPELARRIDQFAPGPDTVDLSLSTIVKEGRLLGEGLSGKAEWRSVGLLSEVLARVDFGPVDGQATDVAVFVEVLPGMGGRREFKGSLQLADQVTAFAESTIDGATSIEGRLLPLLTRARDLVGDSMWIEDGLRALRGAGNETRAVANAVVAGPLSALVVEHSGAIEVAGESLDSLAIAGSDATTLSWTGTGRRLELGVQIDNVAMTPLRTLVGQLLNGPDAALADVPWWPSAGSLAARAELELAADGVIGGGKFVGESLRVFDLPFDRIAFELAREQQVIAGAPGDVWRISEFEIVAPGTTTRIQGDVLSPSLTALPQRVDLEVSVAASRYGLDEMVGTATFESSAGPNLIFESTRLITRGEPGRMRVEVPLGALAELEEFESLLERFNVPATADPIRVDADFAYLRVQANDEAGLDDGPLPPSRTKNTIDLTDLNLIGALHLDSLSNSEFVITADSVKARYAEYTIAGSSSLRARLKAGVVTVDPLVLRPRSSFGSGQGPEEVSFSGSVQLGQLSSLQDVSGLVEMVDAKLSGPIELGLIQRFVSPARARGVAQLELDVRGKPGALSGTLALSGHDASINLLKPYVTRFDDLSLSATLKRGVLMIESLTARLNQGRVVAKGQVDTETADFDIALDAVRYRVDYGLSTQLSGQVSLKVPLDVLSADRTSLSSRGRLAGRISIDRGLARREIDLNRELRTILFAPAAARGGVDPVAGLIDVDLDVMTKDGIRVRNNVADLRATWDNLRVRGTLAEPLVTGVVEAEAGGIVTAYGQVVRVDRGEVRFLGQPGLAPQIELLTTSSLEDPTIRRGRSNDLDPFSGGGFSTAIGAAPSEQSASQAFTGGLADHFSSQVGSNIQRAFGDLVTVRPVLVFGEAEPSARLIVTREIDEHIDIGISLGLGNAEERLYLIDVHDLPVARSLSGQAFTNEQGNQGATLQQNLTLGGGQRGPLRVGKIRWKLDGLSEAAQGRVSLRKLRQDLGLSAGDEWTDNVAFDAEIDVGESLRGNLFPSPEVAVAVTAKGRTRALEITVTPGEPAAVEFEGLVPARVFRRAIRLSYRNDFFQEASLLEMNKQTISALEAEGWIGVRVVIGLVPAHERPGLGDLVTVRSTARRKVTLDRLDLGGVDREATLAIEEALQGRGDRVSLALGADESRERVLSSLRALGWLRAEIARVAMSQDGKSLEVDVEPGRRARIADIRLVGVDESEPRGLEIQRLAGGALLIAPGDPVIERELARAAIAIEDLLRNSGYAEASVRARAVKLEGREGEVRDPVVQVEVEAGPYFEISGVTIDNPGMSSAAWVKRHVIVEEGEPYDRSKTRAARSRLLGTGVFSSVSVAPAPIEAKDRSPEDAFAASVNLAVRLREQPRWSLAYGLRWESEEGLGAVVDVRDRNFLGRGVELGGRALWTDRRKAGRLFTGVPRLFGSTVSMDIFGEIRQVEEGELENDSAESTFQLSMPLSNRLTGRTYLSYQIDKELDQSLPDVGASTTHSPVVGAQLVFDATSGQERRFGSRQAGGTSRSASSLLRGLDGGLGTFATLDLSSSSGFLGGDLNYLRGFVRFFHSREGFSLFGRQVVWAQGLRLGVTENRGMSLPREQRFFAGGEYSVRGYRRESLGPQESVDGGLRALGGEALLVLNQELRFPIGGAFEGVVLFDTGNVWSSRGELFDDVLSSAGFGIRFRSPVGLLRFDVAFPLDRRSGDDAQRFYLGFGHVF